MLVPCAVADELRVLSVERADEDGRGDDVEVELRDGSRVVDAEAREEAAEARDEAADAIEDKALDTAGAVDKFGPAGVVTAEVAEAGAEGTTTEVGTGDRVKDGIADDCPAGTLGAGEGTTLGAFEGTPRPGVYPGMTPGVKDGITPGV
jgi:hypothetical protein